MTFSYRVSRRELGVSFDETIGRVQEKFSLGEEEAQKNVQLYW